MTDGLRTQIIEHYSKTKSGNITAKFLGISSPTVYRILKSQGIKVTAPNDINRKYHSNEDYFAKIDSHEKAQILGFIAADGCVYSKRGSRMVQLDLAIKDIEYLDYVRKALGYTGPIDHITRSGKQYVRFGIYSLKMYADLIALGITEQKSLILRFPNIEAVPTEFIPSFICGHFEGDGCIWTRKGQSTPFLVINTVGTKEFVCSIGEICARELRVTYQVTQNKGPRERGVNTWILKISGNPQVMKIIEWMYRNVPYKMMRKYSRYTDVLKYYDAEGRFVPLVDQSKQRQERFAATIKSQGIDLGKHLRKDYYLLSPDQRVYLIHGARNFGKEIGMSECSVIQAAKGMIRKGWSKPTAAQITAARASGTLISKLY